MTTTNLASQFPIGNVVITRGASAEISQDDVLRGLVCHMLGDWGELDEFDWKQNDVALKHGFRLLSNYLTRDGKRFWIITEHDRSVTTVLLPGEY